MVFSKQRMWPLKSPKISVSSRGGAQQRGGKQMRANANKRWQAQANASKRRGENASKRKQTLANVDKCKQTLTPPFIAFFNTPFAIPSKIALIKGHRSIQIGYRQTLSRRGINFRLQIQNRAARRLNFHYRDRSVGISAENLSLQIQILSWISINFHCRYRCRAWNELILWSFRQQRYFGRFKGYISNLSCVENSFSISFFLFVSWDLWVTGALPSDTKLLLTKNYFEIIIFENYEFHA